MEPSKKIRLIYFVFVAGFAALGLFVYLLMSSIEATTSYLEFRLHRRNLGDIVDKDYTPTKEEYKDEEVQFLNELTDFFFDFEENTIKYKKMLEDFMAKRRVILKRLEQSNINVYDLSVVPNSEIPFYDMKPVGEDQVAIVKEGRQAGWSRSETNLRKSGKGVNPVANGRPTFPTSSALADGKLPGGENQPASEGAGPRVARQFPFSRYLRFSKRTLQKKNGNMYLLCSARISVTIATPVKFFADIGEASQGFTREKTMSFRVEKSGKFVFNLNKVLHIKNLAAARIIVQGVSPEPLRVDKVEAYCLNFDDMPNK